MSNETVQYAVSLTLPYPALVAMLDGEHPDADTESAIRYGLIADGGELSPMGQKVLAGFDQTTVRHAMLSRLKVIAAALDALGQ